MGTHRPAHILVTRQIHKDSLADSQVFGHCWFKMSRVFLPLLALVAVTQAGLLTLTQEEKDTFVNMHNDLRQATGAANMPNLVWSDDSTEIGCSVTTGCELWGNSWTMVFCEYNPRGNMYRWKNGQMSFYAPY